MNVIHWTIPMLMRFKRAYADALASHQASFVFEGKQFMTGYARYLIEFLEGELQ